MRHYLLLIGIYFVSVLFVYPQKTYLSTGVPGKNDHKNTTIPTRKTKTDKNGDFIVTYTFPGVIANQTEVGQKDYHQLFIKGFGTLAEIGKPALPAHNDLIALPDEHQFKIKVIESEYIEYKGYNVYPALAPATDKEGDKEPDFQINENFYQTNSFYPKNIVEHSYIQKLRGNPIGTFQICPVQYNPSNNVLRVYSTISFKIIFQSDKRSMIDRVSNNSTRFNKFFRQVVLNSDMIPVESTKSTDSDDDAVNYIIITRDRYRQAADTLARWKEQLGYKVEVISRPSWTSSEVKSVIHTLYQKTSPRPDYFLIIGDHPDVPGEEISGSYGVYSTDLYYACMDGASDWFPDMAHGRISVSSATEAMSVARKIVNYERNPTPDANFYSNSLFCAYFQHAGSGYAQRRFSQTAEECLQYVTSNTPINGNRVYYADSYVDPTNWNDGRYSNGEAIPSHLLKPGFPWDGDYNDIINNIDNGSLFVLHRDHGDVTLWGDPYFNTSHIDILNNGDKLPVVFSINCLTGAFYDNECFAERFLRKTNGGAVGVFGMSSVSYSGYNDGIALGIFDALWSTPGLIPDFTGSGGVPSPNPSPHDNITTMGDVLNQSLFRMIETWGGDPDDQQYEHELFHYFGDPAMKMWTSEPVVLSASYPDTLNCGATSVTITGSNCSDAVVTVMTGNDVIGSGRLSAGSGTISLDRFLSDKDQYVLVTISGTNYKPCICKIPINSNCTVKPIADFSADSLVCTGEPVMMTDNSSFGPEAWEWTFSPSTINYTDTFSSSSRHPVIEFNNTGIYNVMLVTSNAYGSDTLIKPNYINAINIKADFNMSDSSTLVGSVVALSEQSVCTPASREWVITPSNFVYINSSDSTTANPEIQFTDSGVYNIKLIIENATGIDSVSKTIHVNDQIVIGSQMSSMYPLPVYVSSSYYSYSQSVYTEEQINSQAEINKISFYWNGASSWTQDVKLYMAHTSKDQFESTSDWIDHGELVEVFDGSVTVSEEEGWYDVYLDQSFFYNGTDNLVVAALKVTNASNSGYFYSSSNSTNDRSLYYTSTSSIDPAYLSSGQLTSYTADVKLSYTPPVPMRYISSNTLQENTSVILSNYTDQEVICMEVLTRGSLSPFNITSFQFYTNGTTDTTDINSATLYYTGSSKHFAMDNLFGTSINSPGGSFSISGDTTLLPGENYFWLAYNIDDSAKAGNYIDAECHSMMIDDTLRIPNTIAPPGNREIYSLGEPILLPWTETFEDAGPVLEFTNNVQTINGVPFWDYNKTANGRVRFNAGVDFQHGGSFAATLDASLSGSYSENALIATLNLTNYAGSSDIELSFYYMQHDDEPNENDKVWIRGSETDTWIELYDVGAHFGTSGDWSHVTGLDVDNALNNAGQDITNTFQIKFGQEDNYPADDIHGTDGITYDDITLDGTLPGPMNYTSSTTTQTNTGDILAGSTGQQVIGVEVVTHGGLSPLEITNFMFNTNGTTDTLDIKSARLYYTRTNPVFSTSNQFGSEIIQPGAIFSITDTMILENDTNYFWLCYDIDTGAVAGNLIDAECTHVTVDDSARNPVITAPSGNREVITLGGPISLPWVENFENAGPVKEFTGDENYINGIPFWNYTQTEYGRLRFNAGSGFYHGGTAAATLDASTSTYSDNNIIATLNLSNYVGSQNIELSFYFMNHDDEDHEQDKVWIRGNNTGAWLEIYDLGAYTGASGQWVYVHGLDIDSVLANGGQTISSTFQLKFSQHDNYNATSLTATDGLTFDDIMIDGSLPGPMSIDTITCSQDDTGYVSRDTNQPVLRVKIKTNGSLNPKNVTRFTFNANGTDSLPDLEAVKLYYTGNDKKFNASATTYGNVVTNPAGNIVFTGNQQLQFGENYFWLTYDIADSATLGHIVDAQCTEVVIDSSNTPLVSDPQGVYIISERIYIISPDPKQGTTVLVNNGATTNDGDDEIDYVEINSVNSNTIHVKIRWMPSSGGSYTTDNGIHLKSFYYNGYSWYTIYSRIFSPSEFVTNQYRTDEFDYTLPGTGNGTVYIRGSLIDRASATDTMTGTYACGACGSYSSSSGRHYDNADVSFYFNPVPMIYNNAFAAHEDSTGVTAGAENQEILKISVETEGALSPLRVDALQFNTNGTNSVSDLENAKVFFTGNNPAFSDSIQYGVTCHNLTGTFEVAGNQVLNPGTNYFWLAYDISDSAINGNIVDAEFTNIMIDSVNHVPSIISPSGYRLITDELNMTTGISSYTTCGVTFYDNGGPTGEYTNNFDGTITFYPSTPGAKIQVDFTSFSFEGCCDYLTIYDGNTTSAPFVGSYNGSAIPPSYTSTASDGSLTFDFSTDGSVTYPGWEADISCYLPAPMTRSFTNVSQVTGIVLSGTDDQAIIKVNVNTTGSLHPLEVSSIAFNTNGTTDTNDITDVKVFYTGNLNSFNDFNQFGSSATCSFDTLVFSGTQALVEGDNYFWLTYSVDDSATHNNLLDAECFEVVIDTVSINPANPAPSGNRQIIQVGGPITLPWVETFEDVGPVTEFTSNTNNINGIYEWSYEKTNNGRVRFQVDTGFCHNGSRAATLDASSTSSYSTNQLIATLNLSNYSSSDDIKLSFYFMDHGDETHVDDKVWVRGSDSDTWLEIYNHGANSMSNGQWQHVSDLDIDSVLSNGGQTVSSTFQVKFGQYDDFSANTPSGTDGYTFDDIRVDLDIPLPMQYVSATTTQNETSNVHVGSNDNQIIGIEVNTTGELDPLSVTSMDFSTTGSSAPSTDISRASLYYTGTNTTFSTTNKIGSVDNPDGHFTITCHQALSEGKNNFWLVYDVLDDAQVGNYLDAQCNAIRIDSTDHAPGITSPFGSREIINEFIMTSGISTLTTCNTKFYDNGGPTGYYTNNFDGTITFYPSTPGAKIQVDFTSFSFEGCCDYLTIYDGNTTSAPFVGSYNGSAIPPSYISTASDGSLTFDFSTDGSVVYPGWEADISCHYPDPVSYSYCQLSQDSVSYVRPGNTGKKVLKINVVTDQDGISIPASSFSFNTSGTTNTDDISNAKLYFTGSTNAFSTINQFGSAILKPDNTFTFTGNQDLQAGNNYFWLAYDVSNSATHSNNLDARLIELIVDDTVRTPVNPGPSGYMSVIGAPVVLPWVEDFEDAGPITELTSNEYFINGIMEWDYYKTNSGRLRLQTGPSFCYEGNHSATLDATGATTSQNFLIATLNLDNYASNQNIVLSFNYMHHGEENNVNDRVWIRGNESDPWINIYDLYANRENSGEWKEVQNIDIDSVISNAGQTLTSSFQLKFGQEDNQSATSITRTDGMTFDNISIELTGSTSSMNYLSGNVFHDDTSVVYKNRTNQEILGIEIITGGSENDPLELTLLQLSTNGTTDTDDISSVRAYYTGSSDSFDTTNPYSYIISNPSGNFAFTDNQQLLLGSNYFWIAYDIEKEATTDNYIDAECQSYMINGIHHVPSNVSPFGNRKIVDTTTINNDHKYITNQCIVYPNPSYNGVVYIQTGNNEQLYDIQISNITGQVISEGLHESKRNIITLDMHEEPKGIYFIRVNSKAGNKMFKIVIE